jgi:hypothetical protein
MSLLYTALSTSRNVAPMEFYPNRLPLKSWNSCGLNTVYVDEMKVFVSKMVKNTE